jgi:hypothetical protein
MENVRDFWELNCKTLVYKYVNNNEDNCRELAMYISDLVEVQNVRRDKCRTIFFDMDMSYARMVLTVRYKIWRCKT